MAQNTVEILIKARDEASRVMQDVARQSTTLGGVLARVGVGAIGFTAVAGAAAAVGGAMANAAISLAGTVEQLDRLSGRTGVSIDRLQVMRQVIEEAGGNADSLTTALSFLNRAIERQDPLLAQLGITTRDAFEAMMQLAKAFEASDDTAKKTEIAFKLLGRGGADLIADLSTLAEKYGETDAAMRKSGKLITEEQLPALRELDAAIDTLRQNWEGHWNRMAAAVAPVVTAVVNAVNAVLALTRGVGGLPAFNPLALNRAGAGAGVMAPFVPGAAGDPLADVTTKTPGEATPREKRLQKLMRVLRQTRAEAEKTLRALEALEDQDDANQIREALRRTPSLEEQIRQLQIESGAGVERAPGDFAPDDPRALLKPRGQRPEPEFKLDEVRDVAEKAHAALVAVRIEWQAFAEEITGAAAILNGALQSTFDGLQSGYSAVLRGLLGDTQTFVGAVKTLAHSLAEAWLQELARIAAAQTFKFFLGLFAGAATGGAGGVVLSAFSINSASKAPQATKQTIVNISALDTKSALDSMVTPFGTLRGSEARKLEAFS